MKYPVNYSLIGFFSLSLFFTACVNNEALNPSTPGIKYAATFDLKEGGQNQSHTVYTRDLKNNAFSVLAKFSSTKKTMTRVYISQNVGGAGVQPYAIATNPPVSKKSDGSIDLRANQGKSVQFKLPFTTVSAINQGTVVYKIWATNARGDYRNPEKKQVTALGTLTVNYGGQNPATAIKTFTTVLLAAPLADGSSKTFVSLLTKSDAQLPIYSIKQGAEYASFWDFGYYYGNTNKASLASAYDYPVGIVNIPTIAKVSRDELNKTYFKKSATINATQFDAVTGTSSLAAIQKSASQKITNLSVGDVIEFVDQYGKKGLIKITHIVPGAGLGGRITLTIKM